MSEEEKARQDFGWCIDCIHSMWIADAFEWPDEISCTKHHKTLRVGDKIQCKLLL